jgi:DNA-binding LytR/AlgR family response regulator
MWPCSRPLWFLTMYRVQQIEARLRQLDDQAAQQRLMNRLATAQIHPHFVFNTLASLTQWVETGDARAAPLLREFAAYLRATLPMFEREQQPLRDELDLVRHYLAIMAARLGERLQWQVDVDPALEPLPVPPGSLLTLVENAITHGIEPALRGGTLRVGAQREGGRAVLEVLNSGCALDAEAARRSGPVQYPPAPAGPAPGRPPAARSGPRGQRLHRAHRIPHPRTMTTQILIADDEEAPREHLRRLLAGAWPDAELVAACANGVDAWDEALAHEPAVCFLDIRMPGLTGLEVAQRLQALAAPPQVVFVTAYNDHALAAFEAGAADYLVKPLDLERLQRCVARLKGRLASSSAPAGPDLQQLLAQLLPVRAGRMKPIQASLGKEVRLIQPEEVQYFESDARYTRVVTLEGEALIRTPSRSWWPGSTPSCSGRCTARCSSTAAASPAPCGSTKTACTSRSRAATRSCR